MSKRQWKNPLAWYMVHRIIENQCWVEAISQCLILFICYFARNISFGDHCYGQNISFSIASSRTGKYPWSANSVVFNNKVCYGQKVSRRGVFILWWGRICCGEGAGQEGGQRQGRVLPQVERIFRVSCIDGGIPRCTCVNSSAEWRRASLGYR